MIGADCGSRCLVLREQLLNFRCKTLRVPGRREPSDRSALFVHEELCKVPSDGAAADCAEKARLAPFQEPKEGMGMGTVDVDLCEYREADLIVGITKFANLPGVSGFLRSKLVAGEAKDFEAALFEVR